jgi:hypothetical protein
MTEQTFEQAAPEAVEVVTETAPVEVTAEQAAPEAAAAPQSAAPVEAPEVAPAADPSQDPPEAAPEAEFETEGEEPSHPAQRGVAGGPKNPGRLADLHEELREKNLRA